MGILLKNISTILHMLLQKYFIVFYIIIYNVCVRFFVVLKSTLYGLYMLKLWVDNCELYVCS